MVAVIQKSMKILSVIADGMGAAVTLQRISELTGYPKPTCARILATLCEDGYAVRVSHSEGYRLGPSLYYLTRHGRYDEELVSLCAPVVRWLERKSHATVVLSVIQSGRKFIIDYADREQHLFEEKERIRIGDIYRTATGRAILAHMSEGEVREIYERYGNPEPGHWDRVRSYSDLVAALAELRCEKIVVSSAISAKRLPPSTIMLRIILIIVVNHITPINKLGDNGKTDKTQDSNDQYCGKIFRAVYFHGINGNCTHNDIADNIGRNSTVSRGRTDYHTVYAKQKCCCQDK